MNDEVLHQAVLPASSDVHRRLAENRGSGFCPYTVALQQTKNREPAGES